ncbi:MAG: hypothetical protein NTZ40_14885 [Cyanobacteria bacterium]|nr:hypothetical protein [Cyanobacteriota bacterium]
MSCYQPPELLAARHQLAGFRCRSLEQTAWLVEVAKQAHGTGTTRVFVVSEVEQLHVVAYYSWCLASQRGDCRSAGASAPWRQPLPPAHRAAGPPGGGRTP